MPSHNETVRLVKEVLAGTSSLGSLDGATIKGGATTGVKIGASAADKVGFFGASPVARQANIADATAITGGESPTEAEHNALVTKINSILTALENLGLLASS